MCVPVTLLSLPDDVGFLQREILEVFCFVLLKIDTLRKNSNIHLKIFTPN